MADYRVPGVFRVVRQPDSLLCWAAVGTMMLSWRHHRNLEIEEALAMTSELRDRWLDLYRHNQGLPDFDHRGFARACGMGVEALRCYDADGWVSLMRDHGPIVVVTTPPFHARILLGIHGNGPAQDTYLELADPAFGTMTRQSLMLFTSLTERVLDRYAVWHY